MPLPTYIKSDGDGTLLSVKVLPRASRDEIAGPLGDQLRIKVTAPPVDSAANEAVTRLLARVLGTNRGSVVLVRGRTSRHKVFRIQGQQAEEVAERLHGR